MNIIIEYIISTLLVIVGYLLMNYIIMLFCRCEDEAPGLAGGILALFVVVIIFIFSMTFMTYRILLGVI